MELFFRVLASLNLPAALEDLSGDSIPQSIAEKARSIVQQGGLQSIEQLIRDLPELLTRNREILDEVRQPEHAEFHTLHPMIRPFLKANSSIIIKCFLAANFGSPECWTSLQLPEHTTTKTKKKNYNHP